MASRFWTGLVGSGTGTWDASNILNWSTTSGGVGGASVPTAADAVFFDTNSGTGVVTLGANVAALSLTAFGYAGTFAYGSNKVSLAGSAGIVYRGDNTFSVTGTPLVELTFAGSTTATISNDHAPTEANSVSFNIIAGTGTFSLGSGGTAIYRSINFTGFAGNLVFSSGSASVTLYGDLTIPATMTLTAGAGGFIFAATSGAHVITTNGVAIDRPMTFNGVGGSWALGDNLTLGSTRALTLTNGTFANGTRSVSIGSFALGSGTKTLTMGSGAWTCATGWDAATNVAGLTVAGTSGSISMTSASAKTFAGGGKAWGTLSQGGAGTLTITGANSFADITNTVNGTTVTLPASTTTTVSAFSLHGASGSLTTLNSSSSGTPATLSKAAGTVTASYLSIKDITATGGAIFRAPVNAGNVNVSGNTGWIFTASGGAGSGSGLSMSMGLGL